MDNIKKIRVSGVDYSVYDEQAHDEINSIYEIIDLGDFNFTPNTLLTIDNLYNILSNTNKMILFTGIVINGEKMRDTVVEMGRDVTGNRCFFMYGLYFTIHRDVIYASEKNGVLYLEGGPAGISPMESFTVDLPYTAYGYYSGYDILLDVIDNNYLNFTIVLTRTIGSGAMTKYTGHTIFKPVFVRDEPQLVVFKGTEYINLKTGNFNPTKTNEYQIVLTTSDYNHYLTVTPIIAETETTE